MGSRQWAGRHWLWQVNPLFHYRGDLRDRGPIEAQGGVVREGGHEGPNVPEELRQEVRRG